MVHAQVTGRYPALPGAQMVTCYAVVMAEPDGSGDPMPCFGSGGFRHAAMYIGNGQVVQANNPVTVAPPDARLRQLGHA